MSTTEGDSDSQIGIPRPSMTRAEEPNDVETVDRDHRGTVGRLETPTSVPSPVTEGSDAEGNTGPLSR